jgi:hypothetical protein
VTPPSRRQLLLLLALVVVGATLVVLRWPSRAVDDGGAGLRGGAATQATRPGDLVGDVKLESLEPHDGAWSTPNRDVFRFENKRAASTEPVARRPPPPEPVDTGPPAPALPPPPPPIPLRYIGYLDQPGSVPRVAVLSDGRGNVFNGKEGDIIEGRYRVLRIGTDSADLVYVDGRGRQTIRLSGQ